MSPAAAHAAAAPPPLLAGDQPSAAGVTGRFEADEME
jgi:hypothetical protein